MRLAQILALTTAASLMPLSAQAWPGQLLYCGDAGDAEVYVEFDLFDARLARYYVTVPGGYGGPPIATVLTSEDDGPVREFSAEKILLTVAPGGISLVDTSERMECVLADRSEHVVLPGFALPEAVEDWTEIAINRPGRSWAGILREGPGMDYDRITSLVLDQEIALLARTNVEMNNYDWYRIELQDGTVGYKWGGILCDPSGVETGTFNEDGCVAE